MEPHRPEPEEHWQVRQFDDLHSQEAMTAEEQMKIYTSHFSIAPIIGFGFWRDFYDEKKLGIGGLTNNLILPFIRIQWGYLLKPSDPLTSAIP